MRSAINYEFKTMLNKRSFCVSLIITLSFSIFSFGVIAFRSLGTEMSQVLSADSCFMGNYYSPAWFFFIYIFSFVIVLPHSMSYISDIETGIYPLVVLRAGKKKYFLSKIIATFWGNFIIIALPFFVNLILCHLTFSNKPNYSFGEYGLPNYFTMVTGSSYMFSTQQSEIPFLPVFLTSPTLYNVIYILIVSIASGFLGIFVLSFSFLFIRKRAYLFAPVYLIMIASSVVSEYIYSRAISNSSVQFTNVNLMDYLAAFSYPGKNIIYISSIFILCVIFIVIATAKAIKADPLLEIPHEKKTNI